MRWNPPTADNMQRTVYQLQAGSLSHLRQVEMPLPPPAAQEVSVRVRAIGLNFADIFAIWGLYSATPATAFIPGLEYSGEIVAVGSAVTDHRVGDPVMGVTRFGAYATHLTIDQRYVLPLPTDWSFAEGASYLVQVLTAYYALKELGNLQAGQNVLIHSAAGGVGIWANRIARQWDAFTIGSVGSQAKLPTLVAEGYARQIVRSRDFAADLERALDGRPLHLVLECIGGRIFRESYDALAPMGRCVVYGSAHYASVGQRPNYPKLLWHYLRRPRLDVQSMIEANKAVLGFNLIWLYEQVELMHRLLADLRTLDLGRPLVGHTFPFSNLQQAILLFQSGQTVGKVVILTE